MEAASYRVRWLGVAGRRALRSPWSIVGRGLGGGALAGGLLGAALQLSFALGTRSDPTVSSAVLLAGGIGALVALPAALVAVITYQALERQSLRLAWLAGSLAAALTVLATAALLGMVTSSLAGGCVVATFLLALASAPIVTTRRARIET